MSGCGAKETVEPPQLGHSHVARLLPRPSTGGTARPVGGQGLLSADRSQTLAADTGLGRSVSDLPPSSNAAPLPAISGPNPHTNPPYLQPSGASQTESSLERIARLKKELAAAVALAEQQGAEAVGNLQPVAEPPVPLAGTTQTLQTAGAPPASGQAAARVLEAQLGGLGQQQQPQHMPARVAGPTPQQLAPVNGLPPDLVPSAVRNTLQMATSQLDLSAFRTPTQFPDSTPSTGQFTNKHCWQPTPSQQLTRSWHPTSLDELGKQLGIAPACSQHPMSLDWLRKQLGSAPAGSQHPMSQGEVLDQRGTLPGGSQDPMSLGEMLKQSGSAPAGSRQATALEDSLELGEQLACESSVCDAGYGLLKT